jgi:hypothetical protein
MNTYITCDCVVLWCLPNLCRQFHPTHHVFCKYAAWTAAWNFVLQRRSFGAHTPLDWSRSASLPQITSHTEHSPIQVQSILVAVGTLYATTRSIVQYTILATVQCFFIITYLDIIRRPLFSLKHNISETGFCLHVQVVPAQVVPKDSANVCLQRHLSKLYLKMKAESSLRNVVI